jgi:hypothetical protein
VHTYFSNFENKSNIDAMNERTRDAYIEKWNKYVQRLEDGR